MTAKRTTQSVAVTVDRELVNRARDAGLNMSATLTVALNAELKKHAATRWREENAEAIAALNQLADEIGCFSDEYHRFQRYHLQYTAVAAGTPHFPLLSMLPATLLVRLIAVSLFH